MMQNILYCGESELKKFKPEQNTLIVTLSDRISEVAIVKRADVKGHVMYPFHVLRPSGPEGSFKPMDDQAKALGAYLKEFLKGHDGDIIIQCSYGEIRSPAVASGIAFSEFGDVREPKTLLNGKIVPADHGRFDTFQGRTQRLISDAFDPE